LGWVGPWKLLNILGPQEKFKKLKRLRSLFFIAVTSQNHEFGGDLRDAAIFSTLKTGGFGDFRG
jgi:hypothetical protein